MSPARNIGDHQKTCEANKMNWIIKFHKYMGRTASKYKCTNISTFLPRNIMETPSVLSSSLWLDS